MDDFDDTPLLEVLAIFCGAFGITAVLVGLVGLLCLGVKPVMEYIVDLLSGYTETQQRLVVYEVLLVVGGVCFGLHRLFWWLSERRGDQATTTDLLS